MKKFILGIIVGAIIFVPLGASAWKKSQFAKPIYGADCQDAGYYQKKYPEEYPEEYDGWDCSTTIFVFDDADNKCYLAKGSNSTGLSCVKR